MANDVVPDMDAWTIILMLGATAIWLALGGAVVYLVAQVRLKQPRRASR